MPSTVSAAVKSKLEITETFTGDYIDPNNATIGIPGMDFGATLTASTTPPVTKPASFQVTLSSGAATINLAALTGITGNETVDTTGLKIQAVKFRNKSTNANVISITEGASNGHPLLGASFLFALQPGMSCLILNETADSGTDVASADRTWDVAGTGSQILEVTLLAG
jgi:hypothetical protein